LLQWAILMSETNQVKSESRHPGKPSNANLDGLKTWIKKLLP